MEYSPQQVDQLYRRRNFTVTENHIKLLRRMFVGWQDCETGAPEIDPKRPYGNSYVPEDIAEIVGFKYNKDKGMTTNQEDKMYAMHRETELALQIVLCTGKFITGNFKKKDEYDDRSWIPA